MTKGLKYDEGKLPWCLLPWEPIKQIVQILAYGAKKYAPNNWQKVDHAKERYSDALLRHFIAWRQGEDLDPESGLPHLAHVGCNVVFLLWFRQNVSYENYIRERMKELDKNLNE